MHMLSLNYEIIGIIGSGICLVKIITIKIIGITGSITVKITVASQAASQETCAQATQAAHVHRQHVSSGTRKNISKPRIIGKITGKIFGGRRWCTGKITSKPRMSLGRRTEDELGDK